MCFFFLVSSRIRKFVHNIYTQHVATHILQHLYTNRIQTYTIYTLVSIRTTKLCYDATDIFLGPHIRTHLLCSRFIVASAANAPLACCRVTSVGALKADNWAAGCWSLRMNPGFNIHCYSWLDLVFSFMKSPLRTISGSLTSNISIISCSPNVAAWSNALRIFVTLRRSDTPLSRCASANTWPPPTPAACLEPVSE